MSFAHFMRSGWCRSIGKQEHEGKVARRRDRCHFLWPMAMDGPHASSMMWYCPCGGPRVAWR
eukprot:3696686-Prymnesium_polylepis.1